MVGFLLVSTKSWFPGTPIDVRQKDTAGASFQVKKKKKKNDPAWFGESRLQRLVEAIGGHGVRGPGQRRGGAAVPAARPADRQGPGRRRAQESGTFYKTWGGGVRVASGNFRSLCPHKDLDPRAMGDPSRSGGPICLCQNGDLETLQVAFFPRVF